MQSNENEFHPRISFNELLHNRSKLINIDLQKRPDILETLFHFSKDIHRHSDIISKLLWTILVPLLQKNIVEQDNKETYLIGLQIFLELARNADNLPNIVYNNSISDEKKTQIQMQVAKIINEERKKQKKKVKKSLDFKQLAQENTNTIKIIFDNLSESSDFQIIDLSIEILYRLVKAPKALEFFYQFKVIGTLVNDRLLQVGTTSQKYILLMLEEAIHWTNYLKRVCEEYNISQTIMICIHSPSPEVTFHAIRILRMIGRRPKYLEELTRMKFLEKLKQYLEYLNSKKNIEKTPNITHINIKREIAKIFKMLLKTQHFNEEREEYKNYIKYIVGLAHDDDPETNFYAITALVSLSKYEHFHEELLKKEKVFELMSKNINDSKRQNLNKQVCKFFANINNKGVYNGFLAQKEYILHFFNKGLKCNDQKLRKYIVQILVNLTDSIEMIKELRPILKIKTVIKVLTLDEKRYFMLKIAASQILSNISNEYSYHAQFIMEPEISSIRQALEISKSHRIIRNLAISVANLASNEQDQEISGVLIHKGFLEVLLKLLENQRKTDHNFEEVYIENSDTYASLVKAISKLAIRKYSQQMIINQRAFKNILDPLFFADDEHQQTVAISVANMLYTGPTMQINFLQLNGFKFLQYFVSKNHPLFLLVGIKCFSLLSQNYLTLKSIDEMNFLNLILEKFMRKSNLGCISLAEILRIFINYLLWGFDIFPNRKLIITTAELGLMVKDPLINSLSLFLLKEISQKNEFLNLFTKNLIGSLCKYCNIHWPYEDGAQKAVLKEILLELFCSLSLKCQNHKLLRQADIFTYIKQTFDPDSLSISSCTSLIISQFVKNPENHEFLIDSGAHELLFLILESNFPNLLLETSWNVNSLISNRKYLPFFKNAIVPFANKMAFYSNKIEKRMSYNILAALSYEPVNYIAFLENGVLNKISEDIKNLRKKRILIPATIIFANLSRIKEAERSINQEIMDKISSWIVSKDSVLNLEVCKFLANISSFHKFTADVISDNAMDELKIILQKRDNNRLRESVLACLITVQNLSANNDYTCHCLLRGELQINTILEKIVQDERSSEREICVALNALSNMLPNLSEFNQPRILGDVLGILESIYKGVDKKPHLEVEKKIKNYLIYSCLHLFYNYLIQMKDREFIVEDQAEMCRKLIKIIGECLVKIEETFIQEMLLKIANLFSNNDKTCKMLKSNQNYLTQIFELFSQVITKPLKRTYFSIHKLAIECIGNIVYKIGARNKFLDEKVKYFTNLEKHVEFILKNNDKSCLMMTFLELTACILSNESIRKAASNPHFAEKISSIMIDSDFYILDLENQAEITVIFFLSFSPCTHKVLGNEIQFLWKLIEKYESRDSTSEMKKLIETIFCNLTYTNSIHENLFKVGVFELFQNNIEEALQLENPKFEESVELLGMINFVLNSDNMEKLKDDFHMIMHLSTLHPTLDDSLKITILDSFTRFLVYLCKTPNAVEESKLSFLFSLFQNCTIMFIQNTYDDHLQYFADIFYHTVKNIPEDKYSFFIKNMSKISDVFFDKIFLRKDFNTGESIIMMDSETNMTSEIFSLKNDKYKNVCLKASEALTILSSDASFFDENIHTNIYTWIGVLIDIALKILKYNMEDSYDLCYSILKLTSECCCQNRNKKKFEIEVERFNIHKLIITSLKIRKDIPPKINLESLCCLAYYSQIETFTKHEELLEAEVLGLGLMVYYAYKKFIEGDNLEDYLIAIFNHFSRNEKYHSDIFAKQEFIIKLLSKSIKKENLINQIRLFECIKKLSCNKDIAPSLSIKRIFEQIDKLIPKTQVGESKQDQSPRKLQKMDSTDFKLSPVKAPSIANAKPQIEEKPEIVQQKEYLFKIALISMKNIGQCKVIRTTDIVMDDLFLMINELRIRYQKIFSEYVPDLITSIIKNWDEANLLKYFKNIIDIFNVIINRQSSSGVSIVLKNIDDFCQKGSILNQIVSDQGFITGLYKLLNAFVKKDENQPVNDTSMSSRSPTTEREIKKEEEEKKDIEHKTQDEEKLIEIFRILQYLSYVKESHGSIMKNNIIATGLNLISRKEKFEEKEKEKKAPTTFKPEEQIRNYQVMGSVFHIMKNIFHKSEKFQNNIAKQFNAQIKIFPNVINLLLKVEFRISLYCSAFPKNYNPKKQSDPVIELKIKKAEQRRQEVLQLMRVIWSFFSIPKILDNQNFHDIAERLMRIGNIFWEKENVLTTANNNLHQAQTREVVSFFLSTCQKLAKNYCHRIDEDVTRSLMQLVLIPQKYLGIKGFFRLIVCLDSLNHLERMMNFQVGNNLLTLIATKISYDFKPIVDFYCSKLLYRMIFGVNSEVWLNSAAFFQCCETLKSYLVEYKAYLKNELQETLKIDIVIIILKIFTRLLDYDEMISFIMQKQVCQITSSLICETLRSDVLQEAAIFFYKCSQFPQCYSTILQDIVMTVLLFAIREKVFDKKVQEVFYLGIKRILLSTKLPINYYIADLILKKGKDFEARSHRSTFLINILILIEMDINGEDKLPPMDKNISNKDLVVSTSNVCFLAITNILIKSSKPKFSTPLMEFLIKYAETNLRFNLRFLTLSYLFGQKAFMKLKEASMRKFLNFIMSQLVNLEKILMSDPPEFVIRSYTSHDEGNYFFEKDIKELRDIEGRSIALSLVLEKIKQISETCRDEFISKFLLDNPDFEKIFILLKPKKNTQKIRINDTKAVIKIISNMIENPQLATKLESQDYLQSLIGLGLLIKDKPETFQISYKLAKVMRKLSEKPEMHQYAISSAVMHYLTSLTQITASQQIITIAQEAFQNFLKSCSEQTVLLLGGDVLVFLKDFLSKQNDEKEKYISMLCFYKILNHGFTKPSQMPLEVLEYLINIQQTIATLPNFEFKSELTGVIFSILSLIIKDGTISIYEIVRLPIFDSIMSSLKSIPGISEQIGGFLLEFIKKSPSELREQYVEHFQKKVFKYYENPVKNSVTHKGLQCIMEVLDIVLVENKIDQVCIPQVLAFLKHILESSFIKDPEIFSFFSKSLIKVVNEKKVFQNQLATFQLEIFELLILSSNIEFQKLGTFCMQKLTSLEETISKMDHSLIERLILNCSSEDQEIKLFSLSSLVFLIEKASLSTTIISELNYSFFRKLFELSIIEETEEKDYITRGLAIRGLSALNYKIYLEINPPLFPEEKITDYLKSKIPISEQAKLNKKSVIKETSSVMSFFEIISHFLMMLSTNSEPENQYLCLLCLGNIIMGCKEILPKKKGDSEYFEKNDQLISIFSDQDSNAILIQRNILKFSQMNTQSICFFLFKMKVMNVVMKIYFDTFDTSDINVRRLSALIINSMVTMLEPLRLIFTAEFEKINLIRSKTDNIFELKPDVIQQLNEFLHPTRSEDLEDQEPRPEETIGEKILADPSTDVGTIIQLGTLFYKTKTSYFKKLILHPSFFHILDSILEIQDYPNFQLVRTDILALNDTNNLKGYQEKLVKNTFIILMLNNLGELITSSKLQDFEEVFAKALEIPFKVLEVMNYKSQINIAQLLKFIDKTKKTGSKSSAFEKVCVSGKKLPYFVTINIYYLILLMTKINKQALIENEKLQEKIELLLYGVIYYLEEQDIVNLHYQILRMILEEDDAIPKYFSELNMFFPCLTYHILVSQHPIAIEFFLDLLSIKNYKFLSTFKGNQTKTALVTIAKVHQSNPQFYSKAEGCLQNLK